MIGGLQQHCLHQPQSTLPPSVENAPRQRAQDMYCKQTIGPASKRRRCAYVAHVQSSRDRQVGVSEPYRGPSSPVSGYRVKHEYSVLFSSSQIASHCPRILLALPRSHPKSILLYSGVLVDTTLSLCHLHQGEIRRGKGISHAPTSDPFCSSGSQGGVWCMSMPLWTPHLSSRRQQWSRRGLALDATAMLDLAV